MSCGCELSAWPPVNRVADGDVVEIDLAIEGIDCAACIPAVERALSAVQGVLNARLNFTRRRARVAFDPKAANPELLVEALKAAGYRAKRFAVGDAEAAQEAQARYLLRCLAVAGFGAMNIMLLSVSVWAGAGQGGADETRDFFHWLSALIAIPVCAYAGRPFFDSALRALFAGRTNMDVPISIGVVLALAMSLVETARHAEHAYFDGATMLMFFLLCGRYLDQAMRRKTRAIVGNLAALKAQDARRLDEDGGVVTVPASQVGPGDRVLVRPGERAPVDGVVLAGASLIDESMLTGETAPRRVGPGDTVYAGTLGLDGELTLKCVAGSGDTLADEIDRLVERACDMKTPRALLADRVARYYAPVVHTAAALTFCSWMIAGASAHDALVAAIAVLIITCPCALGLAAPVVQVVAAGALFRSGVLLSNADALERLAEVDMVVFDKTGTLTLPEPRVANAAEIPAALLENAARLALSSRHPLAMAVAREALAREPFSNVREVAGEGVEAELDGRPLRLGRAAFCGMRESPLEFDLNGLSTIYTSYDGQSARVLVRQSLRVDAAAVVTGLNKMGLKASILSGDREAAVEQVARELGIVDWRGGLRPDDKIRALEEYAAKGARTLMIGDGLNDAPALAAAHASLSPACATDLAQARADAVFLGERLAPVGRAVEIAALARRLTRQNLALAIGYNAIAVPLAMTGHATPLLAAAAMSFSSILVCLNALRARGGRTNAVWKGGFMNMGIGGARQAEAAP